ncbi:MAG: cyclic nucleotide-binding protein, partial [Burkholderiales bacterium]|nr:cyclic nucleotide-binding protein [Burkholderiales bacterium]
MTAPFDFDVPPFDTLNAGQQELVRATANLVQFAPGDPVLTPEMVPSHVFLLVQGHVRRAAGVLPEATYGAGTLFGARALLAARA